jgi:hypothetical protein
MSYDLILTPLMTGGYGFLGSKYILGNTGQVQLLGTNLDKNLSFALLTGASCLVANTAKDYVIPRIPGDQNIKNIAQKAVGPALCGGSVVAMEALLENGSSNTTVASIIGGTANQNSYALDFVVGAGSYVAGEYTAGFYKK